MYCRAPIGHARRGDVVPGVVAAGRLGPHAAARTGTRPCARTRLTNGQGSGPGLQRARAKTRPGDRVHVDEIIIDERDVGRTAGSTQVRARVVEHWRASERGDSPAEHAIYAEDAILDYPQSGERFRSRATIAAQRGGHPADRHFTVLRISGHGDVWVSECIISYDGVPSTR
jgi:hypothetical protein